MRPLLTSHEIQRIRDGHAGVSEGAAWSPDDPDFTKQDLLALCDTALVVMASKEKLHRRAQESESDAAGWKREAMRQGIIASDFAGEADHALAATDKLEAAANLVLTMHGDCVCRHTRRILTGALEFAHPPKKRAAQRTDGQRSRD